MSANILRIPNPQHTQRVLEARRTLGIGEGVRPATSSPIERKAA